MKITTIPQLNLLLLIFQVRNMIWGGPDMFWLFLHEWMGLPSNCVIDVVVAKV